MNSNFTYYVKMFSNCDQAQFKSSLWPNSRHQNLKAITSMLLLFGLLFSVLLPGTVNAQTNTVTIKGVVLDDQDGEPLPGVGITDSQKKGLGVTNARGEFSISVPSGTQVQFSFIGSAPETRTFTTNQTGVSIRLKAANKALTEVVVTALGIKREEKSLSFAQTTVQGEQLSDAPSGNWTDALSGKVAGLNMVRSGSGPTGSNKIILRGENNLTGDNEALIVVDGVVMNGASGRRTAIGGESAYGTSSDNMPADYGSSINDINPDDIESVSVLKGPGAAALYGQRGANGAIIITTKSGSSKKQGLGVSINSNASIESVNRWPDLQFEYGQGLDGMAYYSYGTTVDGASTSGTSSAYGPRFDPSLSFFQYDPARQDRGLERTPWVPYKNKINEYFETGQTLTNSISLDGGTDRTTARFSASNTTNSWIMPNTGYGRNNISLAVNSKINDKLTIQSKIIYNNKFSDNLPGAGYGNQSVMYWYIFWQPNADLDWLKNYWQTGQEGKRIEYPYSSFPENPYAIAYEFINKHNRHGITGNIQASYNFSKALSLQLRTSLDMRYEENQQNRPWDAGSKLQRGSYRTQNINAQEASSDFLLRYSKKLTDDIDFSVAGGGSILRNLYNKDEVRADSLIYPGLYIPANSAGPLVTIPDKSKYHLNSFYGLMSVGYKDYLYLDLTGRQDWNSVLATFGRLDNVGFFYPSAGLSFVASEYFKLPKAVSFAKFRASLSQVGSGSTTPYRTTYNYSIAGGGLYPGGAVVNPGLLPNADLKPLKTTTFEIGTDVRLFKSRLGFDLAYYVGNTKNQILTRIVDRSSGYSQVLINAGQVNNSGVEVAINGTPVKTKKFTWTANMTFASNRNKIVDLADSSVILRTGPVAGGQIVAKIGGSMGDLYGRGYVRAPDGQIVYDNNGNAIISDDVVYIGNTIPKFKASLSNGFKYGAFRFNALFDAQFGAMAHSLMNFKMVEQGKLTSTLPGRYNGIIGNGVVRNPDGSFSPNTKVNFDIDTYYRSHMGTDNAEGSSFSTDFIKFREARVDFTVPSKFVKRLGLQSAQIGAYGRNLFIWSPWPMFDPEFGTLSGTDIVQGFETAQFPSTRTLGLNLSFKF